MLRFNLLQTLVCGDCVLFQKVLKSTFHLADLVNLFRNFLQSSLRRTSMLLELSLQLRILCLQNLNTLQSLLLKLFKLGPKFREDWWGANLCRIGLWNKLGTLSLENK